MGRRMGGEAMEMWIVMGPVWEGATGQLARKQQELRNQLEAQWARLVRFVPVPAVVLTSCGGAIRQQTAGSALVRPLEGPTVWVAGKPVLLGRLLPPADAVYEDGPTVGKHIYRRNIMASSSAVVRGLAGPDHKRKRYDPTHECVVVGPFSTERIDQVLRLLSTTVGLHPDHRVYHEPDGLYTVVFRDIGTTDHALADISTVVRETDLETTGGCDVTIAIDSLDFSGPAMSKAWATASFEERADTAPRAGSTRFAVMNLMGPTTTCWEALGRRLSDTRAHRATPRHTPGVERALAAVDDRYQIGLSVQHKPSRELATQLLDAAHWVGQPCRHAEMMLAQALLDGMFVRVVS